MRHVRRCFLFVGAGLLTAVAFAWVPIVWVVVDEAPVAASKQLRDDDGSGRPDCVTTQRADTVFVSTVSTDLQRNVQASRDTPAFTDHGFALPGWARGARPWEARGLDWPDYTDTRRRYAIVAYEVTGSGFPCRCATYTLQADRNAAGLAWSYRGALQVPGLLSARSRRFAMTEPLTFPVHPLWAGLGADWAIWTCFHWATVTAITRAKHTVRRRAGRCIWCAYSRSGLGAGAPCPECGKQACCLLAASPTTCT